MSAWTGETFELSQDTFSLCEIPEKEKLQNIIRGITPVVFPLPFSSPDLDYFRFCTVQKINDFENLIYECMRAVDSISNDGEYHMELEWEWKDDNTAVSKRQRFGRYSMKIYIPAQTKITIKRYLNEYLNYEDTYGPNDTQTNVTFPCETQYTYEIEAVGEIPEVYYVAG